MKVVVDANIILDVILKRSPSEESSYKVLKLIENGFIDGYIACYVVTDLYYFIEKELGKDIVKRAIKALLGIVKVIGLTKADYIVTRDIMLQKHFTKSISPENLLKILEDRTSK